MLQPFFAYCQAPFLPPPIQLLSSFSHAFTVRYAESTLCCHGLWRLNGTKQAPKCTKPPRWSLNRIPPLTSSWPSDNEWDHSFLVKPAIMAKTIFAGMRGGLICIQAVSISFTGPRPRSVQLCRSLWKVRILPISLWFSFFHLPRQIFFSFFFWGRRLIFKHHLQPCTQFSVSSWFFNKKIKKRRNEFRSERTEVKSFYFVTLIVALFFLDFSEMHCIRVFVFSLLCENNRVQDLLQKSY